MSRLLQLFVLLGCWGNQVVFSQDGTLGPCLNGGTWRQNADGEYFCDCTTTEESTAHAGIECEHEATSFCVYDPTGASPVSKKSFCTNHGKCRDTIVNEIEEEHMGCICEDGWEGQYCQLESTPVVESTFGTTFNDEGSTFGYGEPQQQQEESTGQRRGGAKGGAIFMLIVVCAGIVGGVFMLVRSRMQTTRNPTPPQQVVSAADAIEADGSGTIGAGKAGGNLPATHAAPPVEENEGEII